MTEYSEPEIVLCLKPYNKENTSKVEIAYEDLESELDKLELLDISELTVYGIPIYKKGLSDDITRYIFNLVGIQEKKSENIKLYKQIF